MVSLASAHGEYVRRGVIVMEIMTFLMLAQRVEAGRQEDSLRRMITPCGMRASLGDLCAIHSDEG
jgi:hypothetical protein